jgi:hypothetical protein
MAWLNSSIPGEYYRLTPKLGQAALSKSAAAHLLSRYVRSRHIEEGIWTIHVPNDDAYLYVGRPQLLDEKLHNLFRGGIS